MNRRRLLRRLQAGHLHNVRFDDFVDLVLAFGYVRVRQRGSHQVFAHRAIPAVLNLQPARGQAKEYQVRELLRVATLYDLSLEDE